MKNFTKQNFKTNPLWIRLLIMAFMLLIGTGSAWAWGYKSAGGSWNDCTGSFSSITYYTTPTGSTTQTLDVIMKTKPGSGFNISQNTCSGQQLYVGLTGTASSSANTIVRGTAYWNNGLYSTYTVVIPEGKIYIKPTGGSAVQMTKSSYTYTASVTLTSAKTFDLYANDPGASISNENSMPSAGKPSSVRLNYTGLSSPYQQVKITYDLKTNRITFTDETPAPTVTGYELAGFGDEGWNSPIAMTASDGVYTCTKQLSIDDYIGDPNGFKILERYSDGSTKYYGNNGSMTRGECTGWTMDSKTSTANCGLYTDVTGNYKFSFTASTKKLTVTFPTACTPPTNNKKVVIKSTSRAHVYAWKSSGNGDLLGAWPGTQMNNTKVGNYYSIEIPTETDVNIILHNNSGKQTDDIGPLTKGKEYTYQFTLGETTYKELRSTCLEPGCDDPAEPTIKINGETGTVSTCGENGTLTIDANHVAESYKLFTKSDANYTEKGTISNKTIQVTTTGTYVVRAYNGECMTESDPITFTKNTKPSISASTLTSQSICSGEEATLTVTSGKGTYTWVNTNGGENISDTDNSVQVSTAGTYTVTATDGNNCSSNAVEFTVTVKELQGKPVFTTPNTTVCESTAFNLPATDNKGATLVWYTSNGASQNASVSAGITTQTVYYAAIAASDDKCETASDNRTAYTVKVDKKPNLELTSSLVTICQGTKITLSDYVNNNTIVGTVKWYSDENRNDEITDLTLTPRVGENKYYASATNGVCTTPAKADLTVTVNPIPSITEITASDNGKICSGSSATITVSATNATSYQLYIVKGDTYEAVGDAQTKNEFSVNEAGNYAVKALNGTCKSPYSNISITNKQTLTTADFTINIPEDYQVNQDGEDVSVIPNVDGIGEITISYYKDAEKLNETPSSIGTYTVKMSVSEGTEYCAMQETEIDSFSILCAPPHPVYYLIEKPEAVYNGEKQETEMLLYAGAGELLGVKYKLNHEGEWVDPINVGVYGVYVTVAEGSHACAVEDYYAGDFTIICAPATKDNYEITNTSLYYDGTVKTPTVSPKSGAGAVSETMYKKGGNEVEPIDSGTYEVWIKSEVGANYCAVTEWLYVGDFSINCPKPESPSIDIVSGVITCNGALDTEGKIQITNYISTNKYYIGNNNDPILVDSDGFVNISTTSTTYFIKTTNICGVTSDPTEFTISVTDNAPTITGKTITQPGKDNAIELTLPTGISAKWSVEPNTADLSVNEGNSTFFSAEKEDTYTITANNNGCIDTHEVTVSTAFLIWVRRPMSGQNSYTNIYSGTSEKGGALYLEQTTSGQTYTSAENIAGRNNHTHNKIEPESSYIDCEGATWDIFRCTPEMNLPGAKFYVAPKNDEKTTGYATFTKDYTFTDGMTADAYFRIGGYTGGQKGSEINLTEKPVPTNVFASGDAIFNSNNFADFVSLYVTDCSGNEVDSYQWQFSATIDGAYTNYSSECSYVGKKTETTDAGKSNNIRVKEDGYYRCIVTYKDGKGTSTSNSIQVTNTTSGTPATLSFTSDLPIIMVNTNGVGFPVNDFGGTPSKNAEQMKEKISVDVKIYEGTTLKYDRKARMNYRGSSSLNFLKKSYAFCPGKADCVEDKGRKDYVKTEKLNMLGIGEAVDKDWVLYAAAADPSLMRNRLMFDTFRDMTDGWSVNSRYVELIVDGEYKGVYVMMDKITVNEKRVNITDPNGFIVKFDKTDIADRIENNGDQKTFKSLYSGHDGFGTYDTQIDQRYEVEYPEKDDHPNDWSTVLNTIKNKFNKFEEELAKGNFSEVQKLIDYTSWADWFIITEFAKNMDAYRASNIFVYNGDKIEARPLWDQELSFKNTCATLCDDYGCDSPEGLLIETAKIYEESEGCSAPFWFTGKYTPNRGTYNGSSQEFKGLLDDPCFVAEVQARWSDHTGTNGALTTTALQNKIKGYLKDLDNSQEIATNAITSGTPLDREFNTFWKNKSRETIDCGTGSNCYKNSNGSTATTGYSDVSFYTSKINLNSWCTNRGSKLGTIINGWEGTGLNISLTVTPGTGITTPWEAVMVQVNNPSGYDYDLEYTTNTLDKVSGVIINENNDKYTYRIPRPEAWKPGDEEKDGERTDIQYGIKATLKVGEGVAQCGNSSQAPSATTTITLQDEANEDCTK